MFTLPFPSVSSTGSVAVKTTRSTSPTTNSSSLTEYVSAAVSPVRKLSTFDLFGPSNRIVAVWLAVVYLPQLVLSLPLSYGDSAFGYIPVEFGKRQYPARDKTASSRLLLGKRGNLCRSCSS
ncbi:hypothetical protein H310_14391 [Aphanomyces invadans]|uniref:Uncharacterized protein n=1 Tax=Aphanomyces invadans TaxID=157072 RepID=A0A024TAA7_9STRA|nr:hypothetical protein H310_14391 [Aphanomyces invadans]ETV90904.1 hypothetical protein H310_14391 [Aphanomyces invadans]|eukprot:XP_008880469.1 hypothetical protein H310_14391 [Aphanomyces invadans]